MSYTTITASGTTFEFARKDRAVKAGEATGEGFEVFSKTGKSVHLFVAPVTETLSLTPPATVKVCKKDASHGEHRVTKSGSYCYACDRIVAEAQKAARRAAKEQVAA